MGLKNLEIRELGSVFGIYDYGVEMWCTTTDGHVVNNAVYEVVEAYLHNIRVNRAMYDARKEDCLSE